MRLSPTAMPLFLVLDLGLTHDLVRVHVLAPSERKRDYRPSPHRTWPKNLVIQFLAHAKRNAVTITSTSRLAAIQILVILGKVNLQTTESTRLGANAGPFEPDNTTEPKLDLSVGRYRPGNSPSTLANEIDFQLVAVLGKAGRSTPSKRLSGPRRIPASLSKVRHRHSDSTRSTFNSAKSPAHFPIDFEG